MSVLAFFSVGPLEIAVLAIIALLVLGPQRLPEAARSVGKGMREMREALQGGGDDDEDDRHADDDEQADDVEHDPDSTADADQEHDPDSTPDAEHDADAEPAPAPSS